MLPNQSGRGRAFQAEESTLLRSSEIRKHDEYKGLKESQRG